MELTRGKAIKECQKLWAEIVESRLCKRDYINLKNGVEWFFRYEGSCPLCEYDTRQIRHILISEENCSHCPLPGHDKYRCHYKLGYCNDTIYTKDSPWIKTIMALH